MRTLNHSALLGGFFLLLASCGTPESEHPLGDPKTSKVDPVLEGAWRGKTVDGQVVQLHIASVNDSEMELALVVMGKSRGDGIGIAAFRMFPVELDHKHYLNLREKLQEPFQNGTSEGKLGKNFLFLKYEVTPKNGLSLWFIHDRMIAEAIEKGAIKGRVKRGTFRLTEDRKVDGLEVITQVTMTDETADLAKYVQAANHDELFRLFCRVDKLP